MTKTLSIIIVNYNCGQLILNCIQSVYEGMKSLADYEIIVWDNQSSDRSADLVLKKYPKIKLICSEENLGFGRGNNNAARYASGEYLLFLNPDTIVKKGAIECLLKYALENSDAGAWGGVCELPDGSIDPGSRQIYPTLKRRLKDLFGLAKNDFSSFDRSVNFRGEVQVLSGAFMMLHKNVWQKVTGFDETFTLYCEEVDLCYRLKKLGYRILMTGLSRIIHDTGSGDPANPKRTLFMMRGIMHFFRKHYSVWGSSIAALLVWLYCLQRFIVAGFLGMITRKDEYKSLSIKFSQAALTPYKWWHGWENEKLSS